MGARAVSGQASGPAARLARVRPMTPVPTPVPPQPAPSLPAPRPAPPRPAPPRPAAPRPAAWVRPTVAAAALAVVIATAWLGVETRRGDRETAAEIGRAAAASEASLRRVPLLTDDEMALLRRSLNDRHVALAESLGLSDSLGRTAVVRVDTMRTVRALDGDHSDSLLTPAGAAALAVIADSLGAATRRAGVPPVRPIATSLLRTPESQAALRRVNANAAAGRSSHEFGTTFDLTYSRFEALPEPVRVSPRVPLPFRGLVRQRAEAQASAAAARLVSDYPSRYAALLGRALVRLEDAGAVVALRERRQPVYHITAARSAPP